VRARAEASRLVVRVEQTARLQRKAAAADAGREAAADRQERLDAVVELAAPAARQALPVSLRRRAVRRQRVERRTDAL
jgi:hypothetical protein